MNARSFSVFMLLVASILTGCNLNNRNDRCNDFQSCSTLAEQDNIEALFSVGQFYEYGDGVQKIMHGLPFITLDHADLGTPLRARE